MCDIKWQVRLENGRLLTQSPDEKLPKSCEEIRLLINGVCKICILCYGEPFYFIRNFGNLFPAIEMTDKEYHIGYDNVHVSYSPTTDKVTVCCGDQKHM